MLIPRVVRSKVGLGVIVLIGITGLGTILLLPLAGHFVVTEDQFVHVDTALILSGDPIRRALAARDLYLQGRVEQILIVPEPPNPVNQELVKLGLEDPTFPPLSERILVASGVPQEKISFLPEPADGTIVEAHRVRTFLAGRLPSRLAVITSKYASLRACFIFRHVLTGVEVYCYPTPYDPFTPERWWARPRDALHVVMEYQKLSVNLVTLAIGWLRPPP